MNIKVEKEAGIITVFLSGTIDIPSAESMKKTLHELLEEGIDELILDFSEVESIGSSGIGALLLTHKEYIARGIKFKIVQVNKEIRALFKIIKLDRLFNLSSTPSEI